MEIKIGNKLVGDDHPTFIIAEIGSNHNQNYDLAIEHIDAAAQAGVDAVKFQTFKANKHVSKYAEMPKYLDEEKSIHDLIHTLELNREWQHSLKEYAEKKGVQFFSSPCDHEAVDGLEKIGVPVHKVASFDLPDLDLIRYIAKTSRPIILSTGLADWMEIQRAVNVCREENNYQIILLQCTSIYPAKTDLCNLRAMKSMREAFNVITGYSDHTIGNMACVASVALGAAVIEKHFTVDRSLPGPDHSFAINPEELTLLVEQVREVEGMIGDGVKDGPREEEKEMYEKCRRSIHASRDIKKGEIISEDMLTIKRPGHGIAPYMKPGIIGKSASVDIKSDEWIMWEMLEYK